LVDRDLPVGGADAPYLGDVLVVGDADREPPPQPVHRADEAAELALTEVAGGNLAPRGPSLRGRTRDVSELFLAMGRRTSEMTVFGPGHVRGPGRTRVAASAAGEQQCHQQRAADQLEAGSGGHGGSLGGAGRVETPPCGGSAASGRRWRRYSSFASARRRPRHARTCSSAATASRS